MRTLRVGVVGGGYWGRKLAREFALHAHSQIEALCDARLEIAQEAAAGIRVPVVTDRPEEVLNSSDIDLVVISTPPAMHHELALAALDTGKHVLVTRPLALSVEHAEELAALSAKRGVLLAVDHTAVFNESFRLMKAELEEDPRGALRFLECTSLHLWDLPTEVSLMWELLCHDVAVVDYLIGQPVREVAAGRYPSGDEDRSDLVLSVTLRYGHGAHCHLHVNRLGAVRMTRVIAGSEGRTMIYDDSDPVEPLRLFGRQAPGAEVPSGSARPRRNRRRSGEVVAPALDGRPPLELQVENIIQAVNGTASLVVNAEAGVRTVRILAAAQRSIDQGGVLITPAADATAP